MKRYFAGTGPETLVQEPGSVLKEGSVAVEVFVAGEIDGVVGGFVVELHDGSEEGGVDVGGDMVCCEEDVVVH